jgi:sulfonate transport system ATP-binding protein
LDGRPRPEIAVCLEQVEKSFGDHRVLCGIDLDIAAGQFVAIVGQSGSGKSTLLRLLAGLDRPSAGRIALYTDAADADGNVRLMFQEPRLLPWARVLANVQVGLGEVGDAALRRWLAMEALARVGLAERAQEWPGILSGGQKQRVALARALVSRPRLLALDEPLGALDALTRLGMQELIEQVWRDEGFTAVLVTHDVTEAVMLADRILVLEEGRIVEDVPVELSRPRRIDSAGAARIEARILDRLLRGRPDA